jgi:5-amino-6-(5-phosphoribosylamino)uracil reductase
MKDWAAAFAAFVARKEDEARRAVLWPFTTEIDRHDPQCMALGSEWSKRLFDGPFYLSPPAAPDLPSTSLVFVQSRDGNTGARNPSTLGGGSTDKHLIYEGLSRVAADAVLTGAGTIRGGQLVLSVWLPDQIALRAQLGIPRHPVQIVATLRGIDCDDALIFNVPEVRVVLLTVPACSDRMHQSIAQRPWITPVVMDDATDLRRAFQELRRLGIARISCIGGRTLAQQLIDAGLIQDLYLTTSPIGGGEPDTPLYPHPLEKRLAVRKRGTGVEGGVVFEHWATLRPTRSAVS